MANWTTPRNWTAGEVVTEAMMDTHVSDNLKAASPVGSFLYVCRAGTSAETLVNAAWLECNGVAVSRTTYAALNTLLSGLAYPFGSGDGSTTFNLPDLRGRSLVAMAASGHADVNGLGDNDGVGTVASRTPKNASHTHTGPSHTHGSSGLSVTGSPGSSTATFDQDSPDAAALISVSVGTLDVGGSTDSGGTGSTGSGGAYTGSYTVAGVYLIKALD